MEKFIELHQDHIHGVISCFDRMIFHGHSSLGWSDNAEWFLSENNILIKDFKNYAKKLSHTLRDHALETAHRFKRPYFTPEGRYNKEERARKIMERDAITDGLVAVFSAMEKSPSFKMVPGKGRPRLKRDQIPQLCLYYYLAHPEFGLMHVRIQTWMPFTVQIYVNGHEWLARQMAEKNIDFEQADNCFTRIGDFEEAQKLADRFPKLKWEKILQKFADMVNPLPKEKFPKNYFWVTDQAEYSTDIIFKNPARLEPLYEKLLEHSIRQFGPKDVLTFLGKKFDGRFTGDQINSMKKRYPGARVKHWVGGNWMKMYNKSGSVLRIETVINDPHSFRILRRGKRKGEIIYGWFPMAKGVANLYRYQEICTAANRNYLNALSEEADPRPARESLNRLTAPVTRKKHRYGGFNPVKEQDISIFKTVMSGDFVPFGFQNRDVRRRFFGPDPARGNHSRRSAATGRIFKKLEAHGLITKIPRSRRWRVTPDGRTLMAAAIRIYDVGWAEIIDNKAA